MRSEVIFRSQETVANKYKLCQTVSKAARLFNVASTDTQAAIHKAFVELGEASSTPGSILLSPERV